MSIVDNVRVTMILQGQKALIVPKSGGETFAFSTSKGGDSTMIQLSDTSTVIEILRTWKFTGSASVDGKPAAVRVFEDGPGLATPGFSTNWFIEVIRPAGLNSDTRYTAIARITFEDPAVGEITPPDERGIEPDVAKEPATPEKSTDSTPPSPAGEEKKDVTNQILGVGLVVAGVLALILLGRRR